MTSENEPVNSLDQLLKFLGRLQAARIAHRLDCVRDAIMVIVPAPSRYYEIEFFSDGHIESQVFGPPSDVTRFNLDEITEAVIRDVNG